MLIQGCSSSDETSRDTRTQEQHNDTHKTDPPPPSQVVRSAVAPSAQQFKVRADTVTAQPKKKGGPQNSTSIEVRQTPSKTYFAVQIGAFKSKRNVENNEKILTERFHKPVISFYDAAIQLTRICLGHFSSKESATAFLKQMQEQFPNDYTTAWIAKLTR